ncbi:efflux RND transporter periplasmic adaptor subunit [Virgibacillus sp. C22-A2]|uniref:Efflux RND transporter periplasmic adaptor subunit n=1 Tax=Virgibacillus tibetensis TaxID=3042313 RepID=A0ABU6KL09_9BACI|nr:efflux RND transporter periplasmic adaptor subunit [Virgibacillus sp. C22-A2]
MIRRRWMQITILLFIGLNFLLVYLDDEDKVDRISYINNWSEAFQSDMSEKLYTPGVLAYVKEDYVYFNKNLGSFQEFLTEEGTQVDIGDSLYSYQIDNFYETEAGLMQEVERINGELAAIELAISQMNAYQIPNTSSQPSASPLFTEEEQQEITIDFPQEPIAAELMKEQYVVEKEKDAAQKAAELKSVEAQLTSLQSTGDSIIVGSPYEGKIKSLSASLSDPLITIENTELHAEGQLTEQERTLIEEGYPVEVQVTEKEALLEGVIQELDESPRELAIASESIYPFTVALDQESDIDDLLPGYHATLAITMNESNDATVLFDEVIGAGYAWKMTNEGKLVKQKVDTGIHMDTMIEITSGAIPGEWVAEEPTSQFRSGASFITPIKWDQHKWKSLITLDNEGWSRHFVTGLLSR